MKSYNLCMILMCRASPQKNNMGAYVVRTFLGLIKIIQNLYDDYVKIARNCMILMVAETDEFFVIVTSKVDEKNSDSCRGRAQGIISFFMLLHDTTTY